jgi:hypothetical protein
MDECAAAAGQDPLAFRRAHLQGQRRMLAVLDRVAGMARWGEAPAPGLHQGIAVAESYGSAVAEVVELRLEGGMPQVERVHVAIDCGRAINPGQVEAQMAGSVIEALGAALRGRITVAEGRSEQSNFHDYPLLRMDEVPEVRVAIVESGSRRRAPRRDGPALPRHPVLPRGLRQRRGLPVRRRGAGRGCLAVSGTRWRRRRSAPASSGSPGSGRGRPGAARSPRPGAPAARPRARPRGRRGCPRAAPASARRSPAR